MTIISHEHGFIFIKTRKVGGTSIEAALRAVTGPDDVVSAFTPRDEHHCAVAGLHAKNYARNPADEVRYRELVLASRLDEAIQFSERMRKKYSTHMTAREIRRRVGRRSFKDFYRFSVERNPYAWMVSIAAYDKRAYNAGTLSGMDIDQIRQRIEARLSRRNLLKRANYGYYTIGRRLAVDRVIRYENLEIELAEVLSQVGIESALSLPHLKENRQENSLREIYTPELADSVRRCFRPVFELMGYGPEVP